MTGSRDLSAFHLGEKTAPIRTEVPDWAEFLDPEGLLRKAGCYRRELFSLALRELVDNALDAGAAVELSRRKSTWSIADDGPGIKPADVPRIFAVARPLLSSKRKRLPTRGMLGNGLRVVVGAVAVSGGTLAIETRGRRLALVVDTASGLTRVTLDQPSDVRVGLTARITLPGSTPEDAELAELAIALASHGDCYSGPSSPRWYGHTDLHRLLQHVSPPTTSVGAFCADLGLVLADDRPARSLSSDDARKLLQRLRKNNEPVQPRQLGCIGRGSMEDATGYAITHGVMELDGDVQVPYVVEASAYAERSETKGNGRVSIVLLLNRTPSLARLQSRSTSGDGILLFGCGLHHYVSGPPAADYTISLSIISPKIDLTSDGKAPSLLPFVGAITEALRKASMAAYRATDKPRRNITIKTAASQVMSEAYLKASAAGTLPALARQIMYAARPMILRLTGREEIDDKYFTQVLLPNYMAAHPEETSDWNVVYDARGALIEPHTGVEVPLGTMEVRDYLDTRPSLPSIAFEIDTLHPTAGPENRYTAILFIEKEGFDPLLRATHISGRYDIAAMSTKGMSVIAARELVDRLAKRGVDKVLVLHDFDVNGFSIFGTLGTDSRRYSFANEVAVIDIGLRLADVQAMHLELEPVGTKGDWDRRAETLIRHGATRREIEFLRERRVELNAMTSDVFVAFLERKLAEHGVEKVVPSDEILQAQARHVLAQSSIQQLVVTERGRIEAEAAAAALPGNLRRQIEGLLREHAAWPWDQALAHVITRQGRRA